MLYTYILKYKNDLGSFKYYCGITNNPKRRILEHEFKIKTRIQKDIIDYIIINGDFEKSIKWMGVERMYNIIHNINKDSSGHILVAPEGSL